MKHSCNYYPSWGCKFLVAFSLLLLITFFSALLPVHAVSTNSPTVAWIERLRHDGWNKASATAVVDLNEIWFTHLAEVAPKELEQQLAQLGRLGRYPQFSLLLQRQPELAGLLAGSTDPRLLAKTLSHRDCYPYFTQYYAMLAVPDEALMLVHALDRHSHSICHLARRGIPAAAALFMVPERTPASQEYLRWIDDVVRYALSRSDEELAAYVSFLIVEGQELRRRMERDDSFRAALRTQLWPRLMRSLPDDLDLFALAVSESLIWDVLMLPEGEVLLKAQGAEIPAQLLFGAAAYPREVHKTVIELLLNGGGKTVETLMRFSGEPALTRFLKRQDLDWRLMAAVLSKLSDICPTEFTQPCADWEKKLEMYNRISAVALADDFKPEPSSWLPFSDSYYTAKKMRQGREVSTIDQAFLALEIVDVGFAILTLGSSKFMTTLIKGGAKKTARGLVREGAEKTLRDHARDQLTKKITQDYRGIVRNISDHQLVPKAMQELLHKRVMPILSKVSRIEAPLHQMVAFDATETTKFIFEKSQVGRVTLQKLGGIEARVIMRKDAKVVIYPTRGIAGIILSQTAQNALLDGIEASPEVIERAWQQNNSIWWLSNSTNMPFIDD